MDDFERKNFVDTEGKSKRKLSKPFPFNNMSVLGMEVANWNDCRWNIQFVKEERKQKEQKACQSKLKSRGDLLYIDKILLYEAKANKRNLAMAWLD